MNASRYLRRLAPVACATLLAVACARSQTSMSGPIAKNLGVVDRTPDGACLTIATETLEIGSPVVIVDEESNTVLRGAIAGHRATCRETSYDPLGISYYQVTLRDPSKLDLLQLSVAIVNYPADLSVEAATLSADLDGDGLDESVHQCASAEGIHFTLWSGAPITGTLLWHYYHDLGYDLEPTCLDPNEVRDPSGP